MPEAGIEPRTLFLEMTLAAFHARMKTEPNMIKVIRVYLQVRVTAHIFVIVTSFPLTTLKLQQKFRDPKWNNNLEKGT